ncbi:putative photosystem I [Helianthus annuus]|nr:putative photosystem I [Helianthus annuus]KAJ0796822.1 putative photosystem I [Helianthus annuus]
MWLLVLKIFQNFSSFKLRSTMASAVMSSLPQFTGLKATSPSLSPVQNMVAVQPMKPKGKGALGVRCDFIGSPTNLIMVTSTTLMLFAGRFGLAPSANRKATAGLKLEVRDSGLQTGDPAGFTLADTLACGTVGHIIGVGVVLGLKNIGAL